MSDIKGKALSFGGINTRDLAPQVDAVTATGGDQTITVTFRGGGARIPPIGQKIPCCRIGRRDAGHPECRHSWGGCAKPG